MFYNSKAICTSNKLIFMIVWNCTKPCAGQQAITDNPPKKRDNRHRRKVHKSENIFFSLSFCQTHGLVVHLVS